MTHSVHVDHLTDAGDWKTADPIRRLRLERESDRYWIVQDQRDAVYRRGSLRECGDFLDVIEREPSVRVDWAQVEEARSWAAAWAVTRVRQSNVVPFRRRGASA